jgi:hypothetical protein
MGRVRKVVIPSDAQGSWEDLPGNLAELGSTASLGQPRDLHAGNSGDPLASPVAEWKRFDSEPRTAGLSRTMRELLHQRQAA